MAAWPGLGGLDHRRPGAEDRGNEQMQRWHGLDDVPADWGRSVVTIGVFDGVHRGHQRIVPARPRCASELGLPVVVVTFDPHPDEVVRPGSHPPLLCTAAAPVAAAGRPRRRRRLRAAVHARVLPARPDEFVRSVLVDRLHAAAGRGRGELPVRPQGGRRRRAAGRAGREVRLHRRGRTAAGRERRDHLLDRHQGNAGGRRRGRSRA